MVASARHVVALTFFIGLLFVAVMNRDIFPEPVTLVIIGTGLIGLAGVMRHGLSSQQDSAEAEEE